MFDNRCQVSGVRCQVSGRELDHNFGHSLIPARADIQKWLLVPAFAGMTIRYKMPFPCNMAEEMIKLQEGISEALKPEH